MHFPQSINVDSAPRFSPRYAFGRKPKEFLVLKIVISGWDKKPGRPDWGLL